MMHRAVLIAVAVWWVGCGAAAAAGPRRPSPKRAARLTPFEQGVLDEMNRVRKNPRAYARVVDGYRKHYRGRLLELPGRVPLATVEGVRAAKDAIRALRRARPVPVLRASAGMTAASRAHVADIGPKGKVSHDGSDGSTAFDRLERFGSWQRGAGENIQYGGRTSQEIVVQLLIDDGVPSRGHRKNILNRAFRVTGVGCGKHARFGRVCVTTFAEGYTEK
jgi:uncharacterized protein YkwD